VTAGSITHTLAPMFMTVEDDLFRMPANIEVIIVIRKTANVMPTSKAANFPLSFTRSFNAILKTPFTCALLARRHRTGATDALIT